MSAYITPTPYALHPQHTRPPLAYHPARTRLIGEAYPLSRRSQNDFYFFYTPSHTPSRLNLPEHKHYPLPAYDVNPIALHLKCYGTPI